MLEPSTKLQWNWHLSTICGYCEAILAGKITFVVFNLPPGTMKSLIISVFFPAWCWTTQPHLRYLCGSNDGQLATRDAGRMRDLVRSDWYQDRWELRSIDGDDPDSLQRAWVRLSHDQDEKTLFSNVKSGSRQSLSVMAKVTGKRGHMIIWDDPHDTEQVESPAKRQAVLDKYDSSWSTRVNNLATSPRIIIMQRQHVNDMTGHVTKPGSPERWIKVAIPMRYDPSNTFDAGRDIGRPDLNDPRTVEGELLFPELFPEEAVKTLEVRLGPYRAAGQLQQRPSPKSGGEFKREWIMRYTQKPKGGNRYILVDPAGERKKNNLGEKRDNTAMGVFELCADQNYYLIDAYRDRLNLQERTDILFDWHRKYRPLGVGYESYGKDTDIVYLNDKMEMESYRFRIQPIAHRLAKEDRIRQLIGLFSAERMWLPQELYRTLFDGRTVDIIEQFIETEYLPFPVAVFDDMFDMMSMILDDSMKTVFPKLSARPAPTMRPFRPYDPSTGY